MTNVDCRTRPGIGRDLYTSSGPDKGRREWRLGFGFTFAQQSTHQETWSSVASVRCSTAVSPVRACSESRLSRQTSPPVSNPSQTLEDGAMGRRHLQNPPSEMADLSDSDSCRRHLSHKFGLASQSRPSASMISIGYADQVSRHLSR